MIRWREQSYSWLGTAAAVILIVQVSLLGLGIVGWHGFIRGALIAISLVLVIRIACSAGRVAFLSPLLLLALIALIFYSLMPALHIVWPEALPMVDNHHRMTADYQDGLGEALVLQFVSFCIAIVAFWLHRVNRTSRFAAAPTVERDGMMLAWGIGLGFAFLSILVLGRFVPSLAQFMAAGIGRQVHDALFPMISLCLAGVSYVCVLRGGGYQIFALVAAGVVLAGLTVIGSGRIAVFMVLCPLLLMCAVGRGSALHIFGIASAAFALIVASIATLGLLRHHFQIHRNDDVIAQSMRSVGNQLVLKTIARQGVSGWCLDRVARDHLRGTGRGDPFYFAVAVVPRVLWPEKPNLSRGSEYAVEYCGMVIDPERPHSESLTLLGEPIINGGAIGLAVAQVFLAGILLSASLIAFRAGAGGLISLAAMLPWLTQFDQHYALYIANAVKMFLIMVPLLAAWLALSRFATPKAA